MQPAAIYSVTKRILCMETLSFAPVVYIYKYFTLVRKTDSRYEMIELVLTQELNLLLVQTYVVRSKNCIRNV